MKKVVQSTLIVLAVTLIFGGSSVFAADQVPSKIRIIVPGGPGGGWDTTARETAKVLMDTGSIKAIVIQNIPGAGGGKGIKTLINEGKGRNNLILVNSTPILLRHLNKTFPESFRDLTPLAATIADFQAIAVRADSPYKTLKDLGDAIKKNPGKIAIAGGSSPGSMDHLSAAMVFQGGNISWKDWNYIPAAKGGGDAMTMLLASKHITALSTGASEVIGQMEAGKIRVLCVTSPKRLDSLADVPTAIDEGFDATFTNWRGFFGPPGMPKAIRDAYAMKFGDMEKTPEWEKVRARHGWANNYIPGDDFYAFLEKEEAKMKTMLTDMGFIK
jgi:putative tricarboxylic transport membrane protein